MFGIGGLGHLTIQFAAKLGYETIAIARGRDRKEPARDRCAGAALLLTAATVRLGPGRNLLIAHAQLTHALLRRPERLMA